MRRMDGVSAFMLAQERPGAFMHTLKISVLNASEVVDSIQRGPNGKPDLKWAKALAQDTQ